MVFLIPWVPNMMVWMLFFLGKNLLFKIILTGCVIGPIIGAILQEHDENRTYYRSYFAKPGR